MIIIRPAQPSDFEELWPILQEIFQTGETYAFYPQISRSDAERAWIEIPAATYLAEKDGRIVGSYYLKPNQPGLGAHVCGAGYVVASHARRQGIARKLCEHSIQEARQLKFSAMQFNLVVSTNRGAIKLWKEMGFQVAGTLPGAFRHQTLGLVDALVMYQWIGDEKPPVDRQEPEQEKSLEKQEILDLMRTFQKPEVVMAAHRLGVFDVVGEERLSGSEVAAKIGASTRGTTILLDALVGMRLLFKEEGSYYNTPAGRDNLCREGSDPILNALNHVGELMESWRRLPESVVSGRTIKSEEKKFSNNPEVNASFIGAMAEIGRPNGRIIAENVDLIDRKRLLDVGGGPGAYSEEILRVNPGMHAVVADLPITIETARGHVEKGGFANRINFQAADIYNDPDVDLGAGYDAVLISNVLHMEGEAQNRELLNKVHRVMESDGLLMIHETIIDDDHASPVDRTLFSVNMLVNTQRGNCYSFNEMKGWLEEAGFVDVAFIDCFERPSLMMARKNR